MLQSCVEQGFDVVQTRRFKGEMLTAHAHAQVFRQFIPNADLPIIPVFVNAITPPYATPRRCFQFGRALRTALEGDGCNHRVVIGASGGLSHFTASYPYGEITVQRSMGEICADFDQTILSWLHAGQVERVADLTNQELLNHGDVEFRQGVSFLGALRADSKPLQLEYEPFYRALMGFWAGYWEQ
jgi:Catalytic LigB subunit of aromatic ring-opening dioxygenase